MKAYCVKCKTKREIQDQQAVFTSTGTPATRGVCSVCGTKVFRMGGTEEHKSLEPPKITRRKKAKQPKRSGKLVIVESPAKARTVMRILGSDFTVKASVGHVRDLLRSKLSVNVENNFEPRYRVPNEKRPVVKEIRKLAERAEDIYLATDLDREGEAIAWHLIEAAEIPPERSHRVVFNEITRPAITQAFENPRSIDMCLVDAQQGRRILDRLVGYKISPILWRKVRSRLSAGRVQSVALRLIVEREAEIEAFVPEEYWSIQAEFHPEGAAEDVQFVAKLIKLDGEEPVLSRESDVLPIVDDMEQADYQVNKIKRGKRKRSPSAPYITSTMQQEAYRRYGFTPRQTMAVAQQLYEGVEVGNGQSKGLITYMRTDSTNVSELAQKEAHNFIVSQYGKKYLPERPPQYRTKARRAQEAHEAIRPTSVNRTPKSIRKHLRRDQYRLYRLIWQRFVASQMAAAIYDTISVTVIGKTSDHSYHLRASGSTVRFPGFLVVYQEAKDEDENGSNAEMPIPTDLDENQSLDLIRLLPNQHFTQPPARFTDASLVRTLEENGIGRPSTYAPILSTLRKRGYVVRQERRLAPTEIGTIVNSLLTDHFPNIVDVGFTAKMEEELDRVATGEMSWVDVVSEFYVPFEEQIERAKLEMPEVDAGPEPIGRECPECGNDLVLRWGRHGKFIGCSNFPKCRYTEPWLEKIGVTCPEDGGDLVERKTRKGRTFYGCSNYPECDFSLWKRPISNPCPNCGGLLAISNKTHAQCQNCELQFNIQDLERNPEKA